MALHALCPYLVGDVYVTTRPGDPSATWPGTSWERIEDAFLLAAGPSHAAGSTGGEEAHLLTAAESGVAAHGHGFTQPKTPKLSHSVTQPAFKYSLSYADGYKYSAGGAANVRNANKNATATLTANVGVADHAAASCTGGAVANHVGAAASQAHNNMPPYLAVNVWERTA